MWGTRPSVDRCQDVGEAEATVAPARQRGRPTGVDRPEGLGIAVDDADEDLTDDPPADRA